MQQVLSALWKVSASSATWQMPGLTRYRDLYAAILVIAQTRAVHDYRQEWKVSKDVQ